MDEPRRTVLASSDTLQSLHLSLKTSANASKLIQHYRRCASKILSGAVGVLSAPLRSSSKGLYRMVHGSVKVSRSGQNQNMCRTFSWKAQACSTLLGKPSITNIRWPSDRAVVILRWSNLTDRSAGTTTEFCMLSLMKLAKREVSDSASSRRRSPTEMCS